MPKEISFVIIWGIPSKKNRHIIKKNRHTGKSFIWPDDVYHLWEVQNANELAGEMKIIGSFAGLKNVKIFYEFRVARNKDGSSCLKRWDVSNKMESINDMMVKAWIIDDDNHSILKRWEWDVIDSDKEENEVKITLTQFVPAQ